MRDLCGYLNTLFNGCLATKARSQSHLICSSESVIPINRLFAKALAASTWFGVINRKSSIVILNKSKIRSFILKDGIEKFIGTLTSNSDRNRLSHSDLYDVINDVSTSDYLRVVKGAPAFFFESVTDIVSNRSDEVGALHSIDTSLYSVVVFSCCVCKDLMNTEKQDVVIDMLVHLCGRRDLAEWIWFICNE